MTIGILTHLVEADVIVGSSRDADCNSALGLNDVQDVDNDLQLSQINFVQSGEVIEPEVGASLYGGAVLEELFTDKIQLKRFAYDTD